MAAQGAKVWCFADGYLPEKKAGSELEAHEALMFLNMGPEPANIKIDLFFSDKEAVKDIPMTVPAERAVYIRMDNPEHVGGVEIPPMTQYGLRVRSDVKIVVQFGRLDTTQNNLAYYVNVGYCSDE